MDSLRARCVKSFAAGLLTTLQKEDNTIRTKFCTFSTQLCMTLESVLTSSAPSTIPPLCPTFCGRYHLAETQSCIDL